MSRQNNTSRGIAFVTKCFRELDSQKNKLKRMHESFWNKSLALWLVRDTLEQHNDNLMNWMFSIQQKKIRNMSVGLEDITWSDNVCFLKLLISYKPKIIQIFRNHNSAGLINFNCINKLCFSHLPLLLIMIKYKHSGVVPSTKIVNFQRFLLKTLVSNCCLKLVSNYVLSSSICISTI